MVTETRSCHTMTAAARSRIACRTSVLHHVRNSNAAASDQGCVSPSKNFLGGRHLLRLLRRGRSPRSPRACRSASSGLRATLTVTGIDTSGCSATRTRGQAERLDRMLQHHLLAVDGQPGRGGGLGDVARGDRAVQAARFARLADDRRRTARRPARRPAPPPRGA